MYSTLWINVNKMLFYMVFWHIIRRSFFKYQKNYLSQNIVISLILKTVYWTMFSLNAIGLEKKYFLIKSSKQKKEISTLIFLFFSLQEKALRYCNDFDIIQCVFELCISCRNFNFLFIFLLWLNLKIRTGKRGRGPFFKFQNSGL